MNAHDFSTTVNYSQPADRAALVSALADLLLSLPREPADLPAQLRRAFPTWETAAQAAAAVLVASAPADWLPSPRDPGPTWLAARLMVGLTPVLSGAYGVDLAGPELIPIFTAALAA